MIDFKEILPLILVVIGLAIFLSKMRISKVINESLEPNENDNIDYRVHLNYDNSVNPNDGIRLVIVAVLFMFSFIIHTLNVLF